MAEIDPLVERWCREGLVTRAGDGMLDIHNADGSVVRATVRSVGADEALLENTWAASGVSASMIPDLVRTASLLCPGLVRLNEGQGEIAISVPLFLDGLSRQVFLSVAADVARVHQALTQSARALEENRDSIEAAQRAIDETDDLIAEGDRVRAELEAARAAATGMELPPARWTATHIAPEGGLSAWSSPDGAAAPAATLAAGTELQAMERQGDWMLVAASNSWTGWVDARLLAPKA